MKTEQGIALYTIERDGCLTGVYSNTGLSKDSLYNEIARKVENTKDEIEGEYTCSWIDVENEVISGTLTIMWNDDAHYYNVIWNDKKKDVFNGIGFLMGNHTFAVYYTNT